MGIVLVVDVVEFKLSRPGGELIEKGEGGAEEEVKEEGADEKN